MYVCVTRRSWDKDTQKENRNSCCCYSWVRWVRFWFSLFITIGQGEGEVRVRARLRLRWRQLSHCDALFFFVHIVLFWGIIEHWCSEWNCSRALTRCSLRSEAGHHKSNNKNEMKKKTVLTVNSVLGGQCILENLCYSKFDKSFHCVYAYDMRRHRDGYIPDLCKIHAYMQHMMCTYT